MTKEEIIQNKLESLKKSKFRSSFHLNKKMINYLKEKGYKKIVQDGYEMIAERLKPAVIPNDGKQTPMRQVHPIFIAQHACACCCRGCLEKWHHIPKGRELTENEVNYIVTLLTEWLKEEYKNNN
ncbi:MAG: DUF4186 domain-containing protein [Bacilli bacterium]|nr:DUF4186 domain-containing protein [Bacilli bacterium]